MTTVDVVGTPTEEGVAPRGKSAIVVGYDGSKAAKAALAFAVEIARAMGDGEIIITCGHDRTPGWLGYEPLWKAAMEQEKLWDEMETRIAADLEEAAKTVRAAGLSAVTACSRGRPARIVTTVARDAGARMIVVGARGAGAGEDTTVLGSTTTELLRSSRVPVLVVPG
jgi:nucleotide-binding universal stress UspA family protein